MPPKVKGILRIAGGFALGAMLGGILAVCIFGLAATICTLVRPAQSLDDVGLFVVSGMATIIGGWLVGGAFGVIRVIRSERIRTPPQSTTDRH